MGVWDCMGLGKHNSPSLAEGLKQLGALGMVLNLILHWLDYVFWGFHIIALKRLKVKASREKESPLPLPVIKTLWKAFHSFFIKGEIKETKIHKYLRGSKTYTEVVSEINRAFYPTKTRVLLNYTWNIYQSWLKRQHQFVHTNSIVEILPFSHSLIHSWIHWLIYLFNI